MPYLIVCLLSCHYLLFLAALVGYEQKIKDS